MPTLLGHPACEYCCVAVYAAESSKRTKKLMESASASGINLGQLAAATVQLSKKANPAATGLTDGEQREKLLVSLVTSAEICCL